MSRHIVFFVYPRFALLDLTGPLEAFATAEDLKPGSYKCTVMSLDGGEVASTTSLRVMTGKARALAVDSFIAVGNFELPDRPISQEAVTFIRRASARARRTAGVCMGAFMLAESGILNGRSATTHWRYAGKLQSVYPEVRVDGDRIFVHDRGVWTSAGMTAGIDMVLALVEQDLGKQISRAVARLLVVYYRRPGGQSQYSSLLDLDPESDRIRNVIAFAREHLAEPLTVEQLADVARLSVRQFGRVFRASTNLTPAKAIERMRAEVARPMVEDGREPLDVVACETGFAGPDRMRQSFLRIFGQTPQDLRRAARRNHKE